MAQEYKEKVSSLGRRQGCHCSAIYDLLTAGRLEARSTTFCNIHGVLLQLSKTGHNPPRPRGVQPQSTARKSYHQQMPLRNLGNGWSTEGQVLYMASRVAVELSKQQLLAMGRYVALKSKFEGQFCLLASSLLPTELLSVRKICHLILDPLPGAMVLQPWYLVHINDTLWLNPKPNQGGK